VNQRALKDCVDAKAKAKENLIYHLNRRQKQAKAFSRDFFFMTELSNSKDSVEGTVISAIQKGKIKIYVPVWKRSIKVRSLDCQNAPLPGTKVSIDWYDDRGKPNWKERIIFRIR
jgi:hypothetical protein